MSINQCVLVYEYHNCTYMYNTVNIICMSSKGLSVAKLEYRPMSSYSPFHLSLDVDPFSHFVRHQCTQTMSIVLSSSIIRAVPG